MVLKLDLHVHSIHSPKDGFVPVEELAKRAKELGLDGFALTDHDTIAGHEEAKKLAEKYDLIIIPGVEIKTNAGDLVGLGINKPIKSRISPEEAIEEVHKQGGIAIAPHPFGMLAHPCALRKRIFNLKLDAIEVINGRNSYQGNRRAERAARKLELSRTASSDAHLLEELGRCYTEVDAEPNVDSILKAIKAGKTRVHGKSANFRILAKHARLILKRRIKKRKDNHKR